jgi:hypothetical protein
LAMKPASCSSGALFFISYESERVRAYSSENNHVGAEFIRHVIIT